MTLYRTPRDSGPPKMDKTILQERLGSFFDYAPDAYYLADGTGKIIDVNDAAEKLFGHKKEDIIGRSFLNLNILDSDQITKAARNLALNIFGKTAEPEEYTIKAKDGRLIHAEIQSRPIQTGSRMLLLGMVRDVGEKRKADAALRRAVEEIETLVERCRALEITAKTATEKNGE